MGPPPAMVMSQLQTFDRKENILWSSCLLLFFCCGFVCFVSLVSGGGGVYTGVGRSLFRLHSLRDATELPQGESLLTDWVELFLFFS